MLILIIIDTQYLWNVVFSFKKGLNGQNSNGQMVRFLPPDKKIPQNTLGGFLLPLNTILEKR